MKKRIILGVFGAMLLLGVVLAAGCQPATVVVPAPQVTIQVPAATGSTSATGLMGSTVQDLIQMQMLKSVLDTGTNNNNNNGGFGHHHHGGN